MRQIVRLPDDVETQLIASLPDLPVGRRFSDVLRSLIELVSVQICCLSYRLRNHPREVCVNY